MSSKGAQKSDPAPARAKTLGSRETITTTQRRHESKKERNSTMSDNDNEEQGGERGPDDPITIRIRDQVSRRVIRARSSQLRQCVELRLSCLLSRIVF
jgi:hypothetical protein